jgi:hypothetical protein
VREGEFNYRSKNSKGFKPNLHFFLFNDLLLLARPRCAIPRSPRLPLSQSLTHAYRSAVGRVSSLMSGSDASWEMAAHGPLTGIEVLDIPDSKGTLLAHQPACVVCVPMLTDSVRLCLLVPV